MNNTRDMYPVELAQSKGMNLLDGALVKGVTSAKEALRQMVASSNSTHEAIANETDKSQTSITRFINGNRGMNIDSFEGFINACGNLFILQYWANKYGFKLVRMDDKEAHIQDLEHQLLEAKRA